MNFPEAAPSTNAAHQRVTVGRRVELCARLGYQRITGKERKRLVDAGEVPGAVLGDLAFSVWVVVADSTEDARAIPAS